MGEMQLGPLKGEKWKPFNLRWTTELEVVDAMIHTLEENRPGQFNRVVMCMNETSDSKTSIDAVANSLKRAMVRRYGDVDDAAFGRLLMDLPRQKEYLLSLESPPPVTNSRAAPEEIRAAAEKHRVVRARMLAERVLLQAAE